jgi:VCBS repeat-containing protein
VEYRWLFSDGSDFIGMTGTKTFDRAGTQAVGLIVTDEAGLTATSTFDPLSFDPDPVAQAPVAVAIGQPTAGTAPLLVSFDGSESTDVDGEIALSEWDFGDGSDVAIGATVEHAYTVPGVFTATLTVVDDDGLVSTDTVQITVTNANPLPSAPVAAATGEPTAGTAPLLVSFDGSESSDVDGEIVSFEWDFGDGSDGAVGARVEHTYTAPGLYSAVLTVVDDDGMSSAATVEITVAAPDNRPPEATDNRYSATAGEPLEVVSPGVLGNDSDPDEDALTAKLEDGPADGTLDLRSDGSFTYTPDDGFVDTDTFTYRAVDPSTATSAPATVTITVEPPVNKPPVAAFTALATPGTPLSIDFDSAGSSDPDGTIDSYEWDFGDDTTGTGATTSHVFEAPGTFTVTLTLTDDDGATAEISREVQVVEPQVPSTAPDSYDTGFETTLIVEAPGVLGNDSISDNSALIAEVKDEPTHGTVDLAADGSFTYSPASGYSGADSFTYLATGAAGGVSSATTVTITVAAPPNRPPVASPDEYTTAIGTALDVDAPGVLGNDSDPDEDEFSATVATAPVSGQLDLRPDGSFTYTPNAGFTGTDLFSYTAADPDGATSEPVAVKVTVTPPPNRAPVAAPDTYSTSVGELLAIAAPGLLGNDSDLDVGDTLTAATVTQPAHGILTLNPDGSFTYAPDFGFTGTDSFTYTASDNRGGVSEPATVTVSVNAAPSCTPLGAVSSVKGAVRTAEGGVLRVDLSQVKFGFGLGTYWSGTVRYENAAKRQVIVALVFTKNAVVQPLADECRGARIRVSAFDLSRLPFRTGTLDLSLVDQTAPSPDKIKLAFGRIETDTTTTFGDIIIR